MDCEDAVCILLINIFLFNGRFSLQEGRNNCKPPISLDFEYDKYATPLDQLSITTTSLKTIILLASQKFLGYT